MLASYIIERQVHFGFMMVSPKLKAFEMPMSSNNAKIITLDNGNVENQIIERYGNTKGNEIGIMLDADKIYHLVNDMNL